MPEPKVHLTTTCDSDLTAHAVVWAVEQVIKEFGHPTTYMLHCNMVDAAIGVKLMDCLYGGPFVTPTLEQRGGWFLEMDTPAGKVISINRGC